MPRCPKPANPMSDTWKTRVTPITLTTCVSTSRDNRRFLSGVPAASTSVPAQPSPEGSFLPTLAVTLALIGLRGPIERLINMKRILVLATALAAAVGLSGCGGSDGGSANGPIVLGSVNALSGPATFPEASAAAKAVFDRVNADGGINGRKIQYTRADDKADPATATQLARELVSTKKAVALVGGASLVDCDVNGK